LKRNRIKKSEIDDVISEIKKHLNKKVKQKFDGLILKLEQEIDFWKFKCSDKHTLMNGQK